MLVLYGTHSVAFRGRVPNSLSMRAWSCGRGIVAQIDRTFATSQFHSSLPESSVRAASDCSLDQPFDRASPVEQAEMAMAVEMNEAA
jgi:hypothetical protein